MVSEFMQDILGSLIGIYMYDWSSDPLSTLVMTDIMLRFEKQMLNKDNNHSYDEFFDESRKKLEDLFTRYDTSACKETIEESIKLMDELCKIATKEKLIKLQVHSCEFGSIGFIDLPEKAYEI